MSSQPCTVILRRVWQSASARIGSSFLLTAKALLARIVGVALSGVAAAVNFNLAPSRGSQRDVTPAG